MSGVTDFLLETFESEFSGKPLNGPSFMDTLTALTPQSASSMNTFEGYSAWEIVQHVLYYKYLVAKFLGASGELDPYPYAQGNFVPQPDKPDDQAWRGLKEHLLKTHGVLREAIRSFPEDDYGRIIPEWKIPFGRAVFWVCGHDVFHNAQIRSMGIKELKGRKELSV
jgi:hypothetical protein